MCVCDNEVIHGALEAPTRGESTSNPIGLSVPGFSGLDLRVWPHADRTLAARWPLRWREISQGQSEILSVSIIFGFDLFGTLSQSPLGAAGNGRAVCR